MLKKRLVAVLILRNGQVVQSVRFKHTNIIHSDAIHAIDIFNKWAVDEIVILNVSKDPSSRDQFADVVKRICENCFIPVAAGGWVTTEEYAYKLLRCGADKLILNSLLADDPTRVTRLAHIYGSQCIVGSIDVKRNDCGEVKVAIDRGTRVLNETPKSWASKAVGLGVGEILFNSIDHDGARSGYDVATIREISSAVSVPLIAFGGVFKWSHLVDGIVAGASAVAVANQFHYTEQSTRQAKTFLAEAGISVRREGRVLH